MLSAAGANRGDIFFHSEVGRYQEGVVIQPNTVTMRQR
jgi:hypothetical protein